MKIIDGHTHVKTSAECGAALYALASRLGYSALSIMSLQALDPVQNMACAECKLRNPGMTYAFGGLDYVTGRGFKAQAENLRAMGFDGIKMIEGKPTSRRRLGMSIDDPAYDEYYAYLEDAAFPVLFHVADPHTFWDEKLAPEWAARYGWLYGGSDAPYAQYYDEAENMLNKHPRLRAIFAHFFFLSWDIERAQKFLDSHQSVYIDVTAGIEMYENFSKDPEAWRGFFIKNQDRIIFGTDSDDSPSSESTLSVNGYAAMEIDFFTRSGEIEIYGMKLRGLGLPGDTLRRIFSENYLRLAGAPRAMDVPLLLKEAKLLRGHLKNEDDIRLLDRLADAVSGR